MLKFSSKKIILLATAALTGLSASAQLNVGSNTAPDASAVLQVTSATKGFLGPKVTLTSQSDQTTISAPATGLMVYNTGLNAGFATPGYYVWNGSLWTNFVMGSVAGTFWNINGNTNVDSASQFIGTIDQRPFSIRSNNIPRVVLSSTGFVGIRTDKPTNDITIMQSTAGKGIGLIGAAVDNSVDNVNGVVTVLGHNEPGNRQVWSGDKSTVGASNGTFTRTVVYRTGADLANRQVVTIDAVSGDGQSRRPLGLGVADDPASGVIFGQMTTSASTVYYGAPTSLVWSSRNMAIGAGYQTYGTPNGLLVEGKVGIGQNNPQYQLHVTGNGNGIASSARIWASPAFGTTTAWSSDVSNSTDIRIFTEGWFGSTGGIAIHSDARIKNIKGISNTATDLATINKIQVTDYTKIDNVEDKRAYKKVIAQQVESVYPMAVMKGTGFIPNVYQNAATIKVANGITTITTTKAHDFASGDLVRLETAKDGVKEATVTIINSNTFTIAADYKADKIFVYGKKVNDLRSVDYEAISMLNVSATQELAKQVEELKAQNIKLMKLIEELQKK